MDKVKLFFYQFYKFLVVVPMLAVSTAFMGSLAVALSTIMDARRAGQITGAKWARFNGKVTPMKVETSGRENINPSQSYVICCNHQSQYDIFVLYGWLGIDFRWVMKQELRKIWFLGLACEKLGHIFIDRSDTEKALESINAAKEKVVNGTSVLFFPEGTRSREGKMLSFKKGAFQMALDLNLPVLPVTIIGTKEILPSDTMDLRPGNARLIIHKPIDTSIYKKETLPELMKKTKAVIQCGLDEKRPC